MSEIEPPPSIDVLLGEARMMREELHDLVTRLRAEQTTWDREAAALPQRARLTPNQRQRFRAHLRQLQHRRRR